MLNPRAFYTLALWLLLPYIFLRLLWRARKQPEYLRHIGERFGCYFAQSEQPIIWLHTVSVGETRAAQSLIIRLRATYPDHHILLTHSTPTGRATGKQLYGDDVLRVYLPYDYPFAVRRFLKHFRPQVGVYLMRSTPVKGPHARLTDHSYHRLRETLEPHAVDGSHGFCRRADRDHSAATC